LTGRYPQRFGVTDFLGGTLSPPDSPVLTAPRADALPLEAVTIAELLKPRGYRSAHVGKWHLGGKGFMPEDQGFDVNIGGSYSGGLSGYLWPKWKGVTQGEAHKDSDYLTDYWTDAGCKFIEETKQPFFLYLAHNAPHIPLEAPADLIKKYEAKRDAHPGAYGRQNNPIYAAILEKLDDGVGRVLQSLERAGVADNTIVVFTSDNGGLSVKEQANTPATSNAPLREGKGYLYEGGIRVPMIARLPGVTPAGAACDAPVIGNDFFHTFRAIAQCGPDT
jgi:arylsulfatase A-like enzyme